MSYVITYPGGAYGNFVGFTLRWLMGEYPVDFRPFTSKGNSHKWDNKFYDMKIYDFDRLKPMLGEDTFNILHPKVKEEDDLVSRLKLLTNYYDKVVYICPSFMDIVWLLNNIESTDKVYKGGHFNFFRNDFYQKKLDLWPSAGNEPWEVREFLSIYLYDTLLSRTELPKILDYKDYDTDKIKFIYLNELKEKFTITFKDLSKWLNLELVRSDNEISELEKDWKIREPFLDKDRLIMDLVNATIDNKNLPMENLTLVDEAMIQYQLRNKGFELKCYNLNKWPETTTELRDLIYEN